MSKNIKLVLFSLLLLAILALAFGSGFTLGSQSSPGSSEGKAVLTQAWDFIFNDYVDQDRLDDSALSQAAIKGILEELDDPYTSFLDAESFKLGLSSLHGEIEGIGAQVGIREEQLTVIAPIAGSPADQAGVKAGDVILEVDGQPTSEMSLAEAVLKIRGPKGTAVVLLILHQNETEPVKIEIIRDKIELTSTILEMKEDIAHIRITHFSGRTADEMLPILESLAEQGATGIIIDLRHNPGGLLDEVISVVSYFIPEGVVVKIVDNQGEVTIREVTPVHLTVDLPMVVLVDGASASGSEVLSGALQDYGRAIVAGQQTFGKGSVNILRQLDDGSGLYITIARWLTPDGRFIEGEGITPDIELDLEGEEAVQWAIDYLKGQK
ncbi:MAG: S41 family peptidase [Chloroflexi bacterium]|nr:S41 family peptidase [Chloroflexota bacterium]